MAEASILGLQDQFSCPICLEMMKDPVTLQCGHSFCMMCIHGSWNQEDQKGVYSCPQCRQTFTPRPAVSKNTVLAEVVETLKRAGVQSTPPAQCSAGPEDVECDFCTERKHKAIKSCLVCLASFCETHLQPHYKSPAFKKHKLVEASRRLQEQICSQHDKLLEVYCRTDQKCICMLCTMDDHKRHNTVSAAAGRAEKQKQLQGMQRKYQHKIQEREKKLHDLTKAVESHKHSAQSAVQECQKIFTDLIKSIERRHCEVTKLIKDQETTAVSRAEEVMKQLEQEITELRKRNAEMEELSHSQDPIYFLQNFQAVLAPLGCDLPTITVHSLLNFENVIKSVSQLRSGLEDLFKDKIKKISSEVKKVRLISPLSREELLECFCQFTLDPKTSHSLRVSDEGTVVTNSSPYNYYSSNHNQILCSESVSEPCYWEVEWSGSNGVSIAVSYGDLKTGSANECIFGRNDKSWNLQCSSSSCSLFHNNQETIFSMSSALIQSDSSKIGVFVDHKAGTLSFYSVSDTTKLIHRVHTKFTQPLYPGFTVNSYSTVKLCQSLSRIPKM